jgi:general stress protein 26
MKPLPAPVPEDVRALALGTMRQAKFPMMATIDGDQPRVRPVSPVKTVEFTAYVASFRSSHKTGEIDQNARVELCYMSDNHDQVRITGLAEVVRDREVIEDIWNTNPLLRSYLGTSDNPEFMLYRIAPRRVRFMREWALEYHEVPIQPVSEGTGEPVNG